MARKKSGSGKKGQSKSATIKVVPTQGSSTESSFTIPKGGATVGDALKAAGVSAERKNLSIGGKSVGADAPINAGDTLQVEERPQGS
ncbi:MAG TPA: hypothetical protein VL426_00095 [Candidatus Binatia bacterium]|jgi:hypothetical protein|nr:hypothetical protein [Candidatus Binatia bacterium]